MVVVALLDVRDNGEGQKNDREVVEMVWLGRHEQGK